jgi:hypothetical protein
MRIKCGDGLRLSTTTGGRRSVKMRHDEDPTLDDEVEPVVPIRAIVKAKCIQHMSNIRT